MRKCFSFSDFHFLGLVLQGITPSVCLLSDSQFLKISGVLLFLLRNCLCVSWVHANIDDDCCSPYFRIHHRIRHNELYERIQKLFFSFRLPVHIRISGEFVHYVKININIFQIHVRFYFGLKQEREINELINGYFFSMIVI